MNRKRRVAAAQVRTGGPRERLHRTTGDRRERLPVGVGLEGMNDAGLAVSMTLRRPPRERSRLLGAACGATSSSSARRLSGARDARAPPGPGRVQPDALDASAAAYASADRPAPGRSRRRHEQTHRARSSGDVGDSPGAGRSALAYAAAARRARQVVRALGGARASAHLLNRLADDEDIAHRKRHPEIAHAAGLEGSSRPQTQHRSCLPALARSPVVGEAAREDRPFAPGRGNAALSVQDTAADVAPTCSSASPIPSASSAISARPQTSGGDTAMPFASGRTSTPASRHARCQSRTIPGSAASASSVTSIPARKPSPARTCRPAGGRRAVRAPRRAAFPTSSRARSAPRARRCRARRWRRRSTRDVRRRSLRGAAPARLAGR